MSKSTAANASLPSGKKSSNLRYIFVVATLGLGCSWFFLTGKPAPEAKAAVAAPAPQVDVIRVSPAPQALIVRSQGTVAPRREIDVVAQVSGRIVASSDNFAEGGFINQDQPLITIEDNDYRFALIKAEARVADAKQLLAQEKARARQAQREWRDLGNADGNDLFLRKPQLASAEAAVAAAEADRDQAKINLERTRITAPYNGRVRETLVDIGQYVNAGSKIARFYSTDSVEVRLPLTDRQISLLNLPLDYHRQKTAAAENDADKIPVILRADFAGKSWQWEAELTRTDASIDVESRMLFAVVEVKNPFAQTSGNAADSERPPLSIGQFVQAEISGKQMYDVVMLPRRALQTENRVWTLDEKNRLVSVKVNVLHSDGERVAVKGPFSEQSRVVVTPATVMIAGQTVTAREATDAQVAEAINSEVFN